MHAYTLIGNHPLIEKPEPEVVAGMVCSRIPSSNARTSGCGRGLVVLRAKKDFSGWNQDQSRANLSKFAPWSPKRPVDKTKILKR